MTINYSKQAIKFLKRQDKQTKKRIIDAINNLPSWNNIEEIVPDQFDLEMFEEIEKNPDCRNFISSEEALKELGL